MEKNIICAVGRKGGFGRVAGTTKVPIDKKNERYTMNKAMINEAIKVTLAAGALAAALSGCCLFGSGKDCCRKECDGANKQGVNTSMTLGVGSDGIRVGSDSNVGSHDASMHVNADAGANGVTAGGGAGVR